MLADEKRAKELCDRIVETYKGKLDTSERINAPYELYHIVKLSDMRFDSFEVDGVEYPLGYSLFEDDYEYDNRTEVRRGHFRASSEKQSLYDTYDHMYITEAPSTTNELTKGGTLTPVEFATAAGIDITTDQPLLDTIEYIGEIIDEIIQLTEELEKVDEKTGKNNL